MLSAQMKNNIVCEPRLTMQGQENSPAQPGGGADDEIMTSAQERQRSTSFPPHFFFDYKTIAQ